MNYEASSFGMPRVLLSVLVAATVFVSSASADDTPTYLDTFPAFNPQLTTDLPGDVDVSLKKQLENDKKFAQVQRLFDLWSWQSFITLNWPVNDKGEFSPSVSDTAFGPAKWTTWYESPSIFRRDGGVPAACAKPSKELLLSLTREANLPIARDLKPFALPKGFDKRKTRLLGNISAIGDASPATPATSTDTHPDVLDETVQAFSAPMIDQNGNYVFYEIQIDPNEVGYICTYKLYNINGQVEFTKGDPTKKADLPSGTDKVDGSGAWELKLAWRILTASDDKSRFLTTAALVPPTNGKCPGGSTPGKDNQCPVDVGMVGMHIAHKSQSSPQWIWATFEQIDNLAVNNVAHPNLKPSFFDPSCEICVPNQPPAHNQSTGQWATTPPTQAWRAIPIPPDKVALNEQAALALAKANSAMQYYQLIDTQWPTDPSAPPANPKDGLPNAINNKPGGNPTPVYLTNITMETYFQAGVQAACKQEEVNTCPAPSWLTANQASQPVDMTSVFGTESCMGCHSSAGLYVTPTKTSGQLNGDFSWLFAQKAQLAKPNKP
ncbi:hypothetical protein [Tahibacter amnicola]|uniref:Cytochrome P460 n=1 Tax=Tahibacter amnicola TaxID=2976241 RepID=A0ABY6BK12_9GAMM|nr:hypothetical protein [Tahibacter amnicola]UXI70229.1 hypothetical protein N4264_11520 [Tahibacter amnicola]